MSNIIISPESGVIEFNTGNAGSGSFMTSTAPIRLDATGGNVWFTGSNVGIGTTTPATKLHINGPSAGFSEALRLQRDGGNYYSIGLDNGDLNFCYNGQSADGSLLVLDGAADGVGIGTKSPATLLDVDGAVNHGIRIGSNNALIGEGGGTTGTQLIFWNGTSAYYGRNIAPFTHTVSNHYFRIAGSDKMAITSDGVGIGTASPAYDLHVHKANTTGPTIELSNSEYRTYINAWGSTATAGRANRFEINAGATDFAVGADTIRFQIGNVGDSNEKMRIASDGKVGIGVTDPDNPLEVSGADNGIKIYSASSDRPRLTLDCGGTDKLILSSNSTYGAIGDGTDTNRYMVFNGGKVGLGTTTPAHQLHLNKEDAIAEMQISRGGSDPSTNTDIGRIQFKTDYSASPNEVGSIWVRTNSSAYRTDMRLGVKATAGSEEVGLTIHGTNDGPLVGIGTTNPLYELDVSGTIAGASGNFVSGITIGGNPVVTGSSASEGDTLATVTARGATTSSNLTLNGDITVASSKYIGIGSTLSAIQFGDGSIGNETADLSFVTNGDGEFVFSRGGANKVIIGSTTNVSDGDFFVDTDTLYVDVSTDRVGIGVTNPNQKFVVTARSNFDSQNNYYGSWVDGNTAGNSFFAVGQWHNVGGRMQAGSNNMYIHTHNTSHDLVLQSGGGYVGIETNTPAKQLQLGGSNPWLRLEESDSGGNKRLDLWVEGSTGVIGANQSAQTMMFQTVGDTKMTITSAGRIGIGTKSPTSSSLLHVTGDVYVGDGTATAMGRNFQAYSAGFGIVRNSVATLVAKSAVASNTTNNSLLTTNYSTDGVLWYKQSYSQGHTWHRTTGYTVGATISESEGELMRLTTGGKVGIGTNDPLGTTHIYTADAGGTIATNASHDDLIIENNGNCGIQLSSPASSYQYLAFGDTASANQGYVRYYHSSDRMDLRAGGSDILSLVGSKVGIGTTNPQEELDLRGDMRLDSGGTTDRSIYFRNQSSIAKVRSDAALQFDVGVSSSPSAAMYIQEDTRNVGIGTTGPVTKLEVQTDSLHQITSGLLIHNNVSTTGTAGNGVGITMGRAGGVYASKIANVWTNNNPSYLQTNIAFYTMHDSHLAGSETEKMRLTSQGRLGIGVTNPSERLEVNPDNDSSAILGRAHIGYMGQADSAFFGHVDFATTSNYAIKQNSAGNTMINVKAGGSIGFNIANATKAAINNGGDFYVDTDTLFVDASEDKVGIGSSSPAVELDVVGTGDFDSVRILNSVSTLNPRLILGRDTSQNIQFHVVDNDCTITADQDSDSNGDHKFILNRTFAGAGENDFQIAKGGTAQVTVETAGNVGIGTTDPDTLLEVAGVIKSSSTSRVQADVLNNSANSANIIYRSSSKTIVGNNASALVVMDGGNVGIGTTDPVVLLHVDGSSPKIRLRDNDAAGTPLAHIDASDGALKLQADSSDETASSFLTLEVDGSEHVRVASDGKVGIGSTDPDYTLTVDAGATNEIARFRSTDNDALISIQDNTDAVYIGHDASLDVMSLGFSNSVGVSSNVNISTGGQVGIGTNKAGDGVSLDIHTPTNKNAIVVREDTDDSITHNMYIDSSDNAVMKLYSDGASEKIRFNTAGTSYFIGGSVGIGTSSASYDLHVEGEILAESNMLLGGDGTYGSTYGAIGIGTTSLTNGHHRIFAKSSDHMYFAASTSKGFRFRPNGGATSASAGVTIASDGDVGIGTTGPANKLDVYGSLAVGSSYVGVSAPSDGVIIEGNVGIGTSSVSNKLDVAGGIAIGSSYAGSSAPSNGAIIEGYVGIGTSSNSYYPLYVNGTLYATSKYFIIDHPVPEKKAQHKKLLHACIEGPEVAVYFRGKNDLNIIKMPDYWDSLVHIDSMTVELTPIGANQDIYVDSIADNGDVTIASNTDAPLNYFYVVYGERKDVDKLEPEIIDPEYADQSSSS